MGHSGHTRGCRGCGTIVVGTWWCDRCKRARGKAPSRYGGAHQAKRKAERPTMVGKPCCRCGYPLREPMMLDHDDSDPTKYLGWAHAKCNLSAGGRIGAAVTNGQRRDVSPLVPQVETEPAFDPDWGDGRFAPDGTALRQHVRDWCPEVVEYPYGTRPPPDWPGWTHSA